MRDDMHARLRADMLTREERWRSPYACPSDAAVRRADDPSSAIDHRLPFAIDTDRILYSKAYTRYIDKTQVFSLVPNDHITHRALHVQFLSKIARTAGAHLGLNIDLIEAIALGHDIGHPPFGHEGERMLSDLSSQALSVPFRHNVHSVRVLQEIEKNGRGLNLTMQVLDGIACHNGEEDYTCTAPEPRDGFAGFDRLMAASLTPECCKAQPATLEGCLVKICDTISYVGRDFEDAIILRLIDRSELPPTVVSELGDTAGKIIYTLVVGLMTASYGRNAIALPASTAAALAEMKSFNYRHIYKNPKVRENNEKIRTMMTMLFEAFLRDLEQGNEASPIYRDFLAELDDRYRSVTPMPQQVVDFIAAMTDRYFMDAFKETFVARDLARYFS